MISDIHQILLNPLPSDNEKLPSASGPFSHQIHLHQIHSAVKNGGRFIVFKIY